MSLSVTFRRAARAEFVEAAARYKAQQLSARTLAQNLSPMPMETVSFITTETGDDLIVSFAVCSIDDPTQVQSLTLLRTPKYEGLLDDSERGVTVSFELYTDEDDFLEAVHFDEDSAVVHLKTQLRTYELDVHRVERADLKAMCKVFRKMNFDGRVQLSGV